MPIALARGQVRALLPRWKPLALFAVVEICVPWLMLGFAEQQISSSLTGLLIAAVPLVGALLASLRPGRRRRSTGVASSGCWSAWPAWPRWSASRSRSTTCAPWSPSRVVAVAYAVGPLILSRHLADLPGDGRHGGVAALLAQSSTCPPASRRHPTTGRPARSSPSIVGLAVVCTAIAFLVFFALIAEVGPARATVITYVNPAVALTLGVVDPRRVVHGRDRGGLRADPAGVGARHLPRPRAPSPHDAAGALDAIARLPTSQCADLGTPVGEP